MLFRLEATATAVDDPYYTVMQRNSEIESSLPTVENYKSYDVISPGINFAD